MLCLLACTGTIGDPETRTPSETQHGSPPPEMMPPPPMIPERLACDAPSYPAATEMRRLTFVQYQNAIGEIFGGRVAPSGSFPQASAPSSSGFSTEATLRYPTLQSTTDIMTAAEEVAEDVARSLPALLPCASDANPGDACANRFLSEYARRAYRRTPSAEESTALLDIFHQGRTDGASFAESIALMSGAMLQMPQFLYVAEDAAPSTRPLTSVEMASRLSFMFWDSIPDDALLDKGENGALLDKAEVITEARRLLGSPKASATLARFVREWTGSSPVAERWSTGQISTANKDPSTYPFLTRAYAQSINESFDRFVAGALQRDATLRELLRSPDVFVDENTADFYGVTPPPAGTWTRVSLDPARYSGIMTQPALLGALAHARDSSPIYRGAFILQRLMCLPLGSPPANAQAAQMEQEATLPPNPTARQLSALRQSTSPCSGCHPRIDPLGLAFEHFDGLGRYRDQYASGAAIDPAGASAGLSFVDQVELLEQLTQRPETSACAVRQVFRFAMSQPETESDACTLQSLNDALASTSGQVGALLVGMTGSDAFRFRSDTP